MPPLRPEYSLPKQSWFLKASDSNTALEISIHARPPGARATPPAFSSALAMLCRASFKRYTLVSPLASLVTLVFFNRADPLCADYTWSILGSKRSSAYSLHATYRVLCFMPYHGEAVCQSFPWSLRSGALSPCLKGRPCPATKRVG